MRDLEFALSFSHRRPSWHLHFDHQRRGTWLISSPQWLSTPNSNCTQKSSMGMLCFSAHKAIELVLAVADPVGSLLHQLVRKLRGDTGSLARRLPCVELAIAILRGFGNFEGWLCCDRWPGNLARLFAPARCELRCERTAFACNYSDEQCQERSDTGSLARRLPCVKLAIAIPRGFVNADAVASDCHAEHLLILADALEGGFFLLFAPGTLC